MHIEMSGAREPSTAQVILLVEDDEFVRDIATFMIESFGYSVVVAEDGTKALETFKGRHVDALLTDITMPGMNGYELAEQVRKLKPKIPIICMTGYTTVPHDAKRCDTFLRKPFTPQELQSAIRHVLLN